MKVTFSFLVLILMSINMNVAYFNESLQKLGTSTILAQNSTVTIRPQVRIKSDRREINHLPIGLLKSFMERPAVIKENKIKNAPYIIGNTKNNYLYVPGDRIYADGLTQTGSYLIYRVGQDIIDPETNKSLGKEIVYNGEAKTISPRHDDKALVRDEKSQADLPDHERYSGTRILGTKAPEFIKIPTKMAWPLVVTKVTSEISAGDKLLLIPENNQERFDFATHPVPSDFQARVVHVFESMPEQHVGQYRTILLNKGSAHGLELGSILSIYEKLPNKTWVDSSHTDKVKVKNIAFPVNLAGQAMVYSVSENLAYALVINNYDNAYIKMGSFATGSDQDLEDMPTYEPKP